ncbi:hypothetical protein GCM10011383_15540 [Hymenobacter cavernae]|uniref:TonB C-terminal domain-containing protein n=2 Tax=Hymenobacter cavernae TaxID=2044852 RepID=A0ABQ1TYK4_9BACT|nr:hypothetical protein GCM10011383_15540 [Hymenobacter cavernae]
MPEYPGGSAKLMRDLRTNLHYPKAALAAGLTGAVFVEFVVEKDGTISNPQIARGILVPASQAAAARAMHEEALRAVRSLHEYWQPGRWQGQAVRVAYTVPVSFDRLTYLSAIQRATDH